jgi:hypothetical protein
MLYSPHRVAGLTPPPGRRTRDLFEDAAFADALSTLRTVFSLLFSHVLRWAWQAAATRVASRTRTSPRSRRARRHTAAPCCISPPRCRLLRAERAFADGHGVGHLLVLDDMGKADPWAAAADELLPLPPAFDSHFARSFTPHAAGHAEDDRRIPHNKAFLARSFPCDFDQNARRSPVRDGADFPSSQPARTAMRRPSPPSVLARVQPALEPV